MAVRDLARLASGATWPAKPLARREGAGERPRRPRGVIRPVIDDGAAAARRTRDATRPARGVSIPRHARHRDLRDERETSGEPRASWSGPKSTTAPHAARR